MNEWYLMLRATWTPIANQLMSEDTRFSYTISIFMKM
jgi:hypothetical protein